MHFTLCHISSRQNDYRKYEAEVNRLQDLKKKLEDQFTMSSSSVLYDEAAERAKLEKLSKEELIGKAGYKTSVKSPAALINIILMKDKKNLNNAFVA